MSMKFHKFSREGVFNGDRFSISSKSSKIIFISKRCSNRRVGDIFFLDFREEWKKFFSECFFKFLFIFKVAFFSLDLIFSEVDKFFCLSFYYHNNALFIKFFPQSGLFLGGKRKENLCFFDFIFFQINSSAFFQVKIKVSDIMVPQIIARQAKIFLFNSQK